MGRLVQMARKMKNEALGNQIAKQNTEAIEFQTFYNSSFYPKFKEGVKRHLDELDRSAVTDPGKLILLQGERNALIKILDDLDRLERRTNNIMRPKH